MDAEQIQTLRALLATQSTLSDAGTPKLVRKLSRFLAPRPASWSPILVLLESDAPIEPAPQTQAAPFQSEVLQTLEHPIPPQILLGDLIPRRSAFGQRKEAVLELKEEAPPESRRLLLLAADGAPVGEIVLHAADMKLKEARPRRPFDVLPCEAPFFPEDLADEPRPLRRPIFGKATPKPTPGLSSLPPGELDAVFLLANLAARLAGEEAALRRRLLTVQNAAKVA